MSATNSVDSFLRSFKSHGEYASGSSFAIELAPPECLSVFSNTGSDVTRELDFYANNVVFPGRQSSLIENTENGVPVRVSAGHANEPVSITFLLTSDMFLFHFMTKWFEQSSNDEKFTIGYFEEVISQVMKIHTIDRKTGNITATCELQKVYPSAINGAALSNSARDTPIEITVEFTYWSLFWTHPNINYTTHFPDWGEGNQEAPNYDFTKPLPNDLAQYGFPSNALDTGAYLGADPYYSKAFASTTSPDTFGDNRLSL